jgi:hypothetical protein
MRHILAFFLGSIIFLNVTAQTVTSFSEEKFVEEFTTYVQKSKREESIASSAAFVPVYNGLSASLKADVRATANGMLTNKVRNYPVFTTYIDIINLIVSKSAEGVSTEHITILKKLMDASTPSSYKQFEDYLEYLPTLFDSKALYATKTKGWYFEPNAKYSVSVEEGKPVLTFTNVTIYGLTKTDSLVIANTSGKCYPNQKEWVGKSGKMTFERAKIPAAEAFVELTDYTLGLEKTDYRFDSVYLVYPKHVEGKILGDFDEKLFSAATTSVTYPQFQSRALDLNIKNIHERITTSGGITLLGDKLIISGSPEKYATLTLSTKGKKQVTAVAQQFVVNKAKQEIVAERAEVGILLAKDSIYHPALLFRFKMDENRLSLEKEEGLNSKTPYESPYHNMTIGLNALSYHLDSTNIQFRTIDKYTGTPVSITSFDYYVPGGEMQHLTLSGKNPLQMIKAMADSYGHNNLTGYDVSGSFGYPLKEVESIIFKIAQEGFVFYDPVTKRMKVNYKTHHYMDAGKGVVDYDYMQFISNPKASNLNGILNIDSQSIKLYGIENFELSRPKQVAAFPKNNQMTLLQDRDLRFEGVLQAGNLLFKGEGIHFDYEGFKADMESVDSLIIYVQGPVDMNGEMRYVPLRSVLSDIKGALFIDSPGNRSGINKYEEYPYFESYDTAFVYFDHYDSTAYKRDNFYFAVLPFKLDSIVTTITDSIQLFGELVSADIFVPFQTYLSVQPDYTLGINEIAPASGLAIYKGAGKFFGSYYMTSKGLSGEGKIQYKQSEFSGEKIKFYQDSMYVDADTFNLIESVTADIPQANASKVAINWLPYEDKLTVDADGKPYAFYNNQLTYTGGLLYEAGVLSGIADSGGVAKYEFFGAEISSAEGTFKKDFVTTTDGTISIANAQGQDFLSGYFGSAVLNFKNGSATFDNPSDSFLVELPGMISNMQHYVWDFKIGKIKFENNEQNSQYFLLTDEALDSFQVFAKTAIYDIETGTLEAYDIEEITLADSKLIPEGKKLTILAGGKFDAINNATLVLNSKESFFTITSANLVVNSRNDFQGTGSYKYEGESGVHYVVIDEIKVHIDTNIVDKKNTEYLYSVDARGVISEEDNFRFNKEMLYKGNLFMTSTSKDIKFQGFGKLDFKQKETSSWFNLDQGIDPLNFSLKLDSLKDEYKQDVTAGLFVSPGELEVYSVIMEPVRAKTDPALHLVTGSLFKGSQEGEFIFGTADTNKTIDLSKSFMKYNDNTGAISIDGFLQWTSGMVKVKVNGFGTMEFDPATKKANGKSVIALDFPMDKLIWYEWPRDIVELNYEAKAIDYNRPEIKRAFSNLITVPADANLILEDIQSAGLFKLPVSFQPKVLLTDVELEWDEMDGNFKSVNTIGLSAIAGYPIDQQMKAYTEFGHSLGSGYMNLYFETKEGTWYFISARNGVLYALSSDSDFNDMVEGSKEKQIAAEGKKGEFIHEFSLGNLTSKVTFMSRIDEFLIRTTGKGLEVAPKVVVPQVIQDTTTIQEPMDSTIVPVLENNFEQMLKEGAPENKKVEGLPWNAPKKEVEEKIVPIEKVDTVIQDTSKTLIAPLKETKEEVTPKVEETKPEQPKTEEAKPKETKPEPPKPEENKKEPKKTQVQPEVVKPVLEEEKKEVPEEEYEEVIDGKKSKKTPKM